MPSPFSKTPSPEETPGFVSITNSILVCDKCFIEVEEGQYEVATKTLSFVCPKGHVNVVRNIEI